MNFIQTIKWEWILLVRAPYKLIAIALFCLAAIYGVSNGISLYQKQLETIAIAEANSRKQQESVLSWFAEGKTGPEDRPWIDVSVPFWAMWYSAHQVNKVPSPMMAFAIGQAENYGFYKRVNVWSTAYDNDLAAEISNPERVVLGSLDFSFVTIFLLPLLLIILTFSIGGYEQDKQLTSLIQVQRGSYSRWVMGRVVAVGLLISGMMIVLILGAGAWTETLVNSTQSLLLFLAVVLAYLWFWMILIGGLIRLKTGQTAQAMGITLIWVILALVIPGLVHQSASIRYPNNLMVKYLDSKRVDQEKIYAMEYKEIWKEVSTKLPELKETKLAAQPDSLKAPLVTGGLHRTEISFHMNEVFEAIEEGFEEKNQFIENSYWFNPLVGIQNFLFHLSETDFQAYQAYRRKIQESNLEICKQVVLDEWNEEKVSLDKYKSYLSLLSEQ
jgi:ABC-2 type transport system permease protein